MWGSPQLIDNVVFIYIYICIVMSIDHSRFIYICVCVVVPWGVLSVGVPTPD